MYACRPAAISERTKSYTPGRLSGERSDVFTGVRPGGISSSRLRSRSPCSAMASERGIGVADITLEHTIHPLRRYHVSMDRPKRSGLSPCQFEGQRFVQRANEVIGSTVRDPGPFFRRSFSSLRLNKLEEEELVERKATPATFGVVDRLGSMQPRQRLLERG